MVGGEGSPLGLRQHVLTVPHAHGRWDARGLERDDEFVADRLGVVFAARAGYDPYALLDVLTTIDSLDPHNPNLSLMFSTHPPTADRLSQLDRAMDGKMDKYAVSSGSDARFLKMRARLLR